MLLSATLKAVLLSTAAVFIASSGSYAFAQNAGGSAGDEGQAAAGADATEVEEVVVTGSNIRGVRSVGSPTTIIDREQIEESGLTTASQILGTLTQTQSNSTFSSEQPHQANPYIGSNITGGALFNNESRGSSVDIRGLGANATLVLVDGRRQAPTGTVASFSEANILPLAAIERIEVVSDGASAVYGSNAIGGVVNYITRKDYDGVEVSGRFSTNRLSDGIGGSVTVGKPWLLKGRQGRVLATYDYSHSGSISYADDPRIASDLTQFGGGDAIYSSFQRPAPTGLGYYIAQTCPAPAFIFFGTCFNPNFTPGGVNQFFDVAGLTPGGRPTGTAVAPGSLPANSLASTDAFRDYTGKAERHSVNAYVSQDLTDNLRIYYQGTYSQRQEKSRNYDVFPLALTDASPFFPVNAPPLATSVIVPVGVSSTSTILSKSNVNTVGLDWTFARDWKSEAYVSWSGSRSLTQGLGGRSPNSEVLNYLILSGDYNPFLGLTDDVRDLATYTGPLSGGGESSSKEAVIRANGPIMELPGGTLRGAFGVQGSKLKNDYRFFSTPGGACAGLTPPTDVCTVPAPVFSTERSGQDSRDIKAVFAELFVPVIGENNALPFVQGLDLSLAARYEEYSDFGDTFNPRVGLVWDVVDSLSVRGSWGTAFRAPNLIEMSANFIGYVGPGTNNGGAGSGPSGPTQVVIVGGGNPNLGPEESDNITAGFDFKPIDGLRISATYYKIDYSNKIQALPIQSFLSSPENFALYAPFIQVVAGATVGGPNPAGCNPLVPSTWAPEIRAILPNEPRTDGVCAATHILDGRWVNASKVVQDGLDIDVRYDWQNSYGAFNAGVSISKILGIDEEVVLGQATTPEPLGRIFRPLDLRVRGSVGWSDGPWSTNFFVNYTPSYINDLPITPVGPSGPLPTLPVSEVESWVTADMGISYRTPTGSGKLDGLRLSLNVQNITDKDPPVVLVGNQAFDAGAHSLFGRTWTFQVTKAY